MKKLFLIIVLAVLGITAKAQAVSDMAVIPIGVTLNSIARLTVTSGGNIEFVVNTMDQYENGVDFMPSTTTTFTVASSSPFGVTLQADNANLIGTISAEHKMPVEFVEYSMGTTTSGTPQINQNLVAYEKLSTTEKWIIGEDKADHPAGVYNGIKIQWSLTSGNNQGALKGYASDRYVVNAFLQLKQTTK